MPTLYLHVHVGSFWFALLLWVLLYSLKHRVLHFIPKVVRFVVRCVFMKRELYFSDQKSKKKPHFSTPFSVLCPIDTVILLQFLLRFTL